MRFAIFIFSVILSITLQGQVAQTDTTSDGKYILQTMVVDGDTIPVVTLSTQTVASYRKSRSKRYRRKWSKMHRNVVKTYPYAKLAGDLINEYNRNLSELPTEAEREAYLDRCEEDLKAEFEDDLKKMTTSQGRVLIKLIDRETGDTSYELIKQLRNGFTAFVWQGVAKLFGSDLKANYDPLSNETDYMIEEIVSMIESGQIQVETREVKTMEASEVLKNKSRRLERKIKRQKRRQERNG
jgi:hypothetical protein